MLAPDRGDLGADPDFDPYAPDCPSRQLVDRIGGKWTVLVIGVLSAGPARYRDLAAQVLGITPKMLSSTLKTLERDGLITREVHAEIPPRVVYDLTPAGRTLGPILRDLQDWAREHMSQVLTSQAEYDQR